MAAVSSVTRFLAIAGLGYAALVAALLFGMFAARSSVTKNFVTPAARRAWADWQKNTVPDGSANQPVRRSISRSAEPPTLILLRDYFGVCTAAAISITTALYWTLAFFLRGVMSGPAFPVEYRDATENRRP